MCEDVIDKCLCKKSLVGQGSPCRFGRVSMSLVDKAETLRTQLGLEQGPIIGIINQACSQLGLDAELEGMSLVDKASVCLTHLGGSATALMATADEVVGEAEVLPVVTLGDEGSAVPPVPQKMGRLAEEAVPPSILPKELEGCYCLAGGEGGVPSSLMFSCKTASEDEVAETWRCHLALCFVIPFVFPWCLATSLKREGQSNSFKGHSSIIAPVWHRFEKKGSTIVCREQWGPTWQSRGWKIV